MLYQKLFRWFLILGLLGLVLIIAIKDKLKFRMLILFSKYRNLLPFIIAQAKHETANFTSKVYAVDRNAFGIKFINSANQKNAVKGLLSPEGNNYARFNSETDSLIDLFRIFEIKKFPVNVGSASEYAAALKERGYFTGDLVVYQKALEKWVS